MTCLIPSLRLCVLIGWSLITIWALPPWRRAIFADADTADFASVAMGVVGVTIVGFQLNAIVNGQHLPPTYWTTVNLLMLAIAAAVVIFCVHLRQTPPGHKRALVLSHLAILAACIAGGLLA